MADSYMADSVTSAYNQESKKESRSKLIQHAVRCLTTERSTSVCVKQDHVARVWKQLRESGKADEYFTEEERQEIKTEIDQWELFHDSQVQTKKPSDLRVCYLGGDNPLNDLEVLVANGVLRQNVWAIEKDSKTLEKAYKAIENSQLRNFKLFKGNILTFLKDFQGQFDIIYFDACGTLPAAKQNTLKVIGYVFLYDKLTSPGALITNFSFPLQQENSASSQDDDKERKMINVLVEEYMKYRLCNVLRKDNSPENNAEYLNKRTDEDNYGDYISFQVIDSAYLFIPAQRMLSSKGKSLWGQIFSNKQDFLQEINSHSSSNEENASTNEETTTKDTNEKSTKTTRNQELMAFQEELKNKYKICMSNSFYLREMAENVDEKSNENSCCNAWVAEIFPDWKSDPSLKDKKIPSMLLTPLLFSSPLHIVSFSNYDLASKGLEPFLKAVDDGRFPSCCDVASTEQATFLLAGLLYGQMAYPSFPVMDKLFRLRYTAKKRQMFADAFVFDKCRYMYDQFPTVNCVPFVIVEPKEQMVFRMVVDGLRKHLGGICSKDLFEFCNVASRDAVTEGGVSFPNSERSIPERQEIENKLLKEKQT